MSSGPDESPGRPFVLAEPVRLRLVQIAAEVLGRLPADQVPSSLKAVARFTPAKRQRLGAPAIAGALDSDASFRDAVAAAIDTVAASVLDAGREGGGLGASDPLDVAAVAFLHRAQGWEAVVADATARWTAENAPREAASDQLERLRAELADVRAQLRTALARAKQAEGELAARPDTGDEAAQVAKLTRDLRMRTGELRSAERERDEARTALRTAVDDAEGAARAAADAAAQAASAEVLSLRARVDELERSGDAVRRTARQDRELDDARLRLLVETLTDAAAGIRRELALPASTLRPADAVAPGAEHPASSQRGASDASTLDRLLALPQVHLVVDGYNVTKTGYPDLPLADQRSRLVTALAALHARAGAETTVAFDGGARPAAPTRAPRGVRVLFSAEDQIADDLIRQLVAAEPAGRPVVVVTSDQAVVTDVRAAGAWTAPAAVLLALLG